MALRTICAVALRSGKDLGVNNAKKFVTTGMVAKFLISLITHSSCLKTFYSSWTPRSHKASLLADRQRVQGETNQTQRNHWYCIGMNKCNFVQCIKIFDAFSETVAVREYIQTLHIRLMQQNNGSASCVVFRVVSGINISFLKQSHSFFFSF